MKNRMMDAKRLDAWQRIFCHEIAMLILISLFQKGKCAICVAMAKYQLFNTFYLDFLLQFGKEAFLFDCWQKRFPTVLQEKLERKYKFQKKQTFDQA